MTGASQIKLCGELKFRRNIHVKRFETIRAVNCYRFLWISFRGGGRAFAAAQAGQQGCPKKDMFWQSHSRLVAFVVDPGLRGADSASSTKRSSQRELVLCALNNATAGRKLLFGSVLLCVAVLLCIVLASLVVELSTPAKLRCPSMHVNGSREQPDVVFFVVGQFCNGQDGI